MLFDNRWFFIFRQPITRFTCQPLHLTPVAFVMTADSAIDDISRETTIPTLFGKYNQVQIANSLVEAGVTPVNLIPPDLRSRSDIGWTIESQLEAQGAALRTSYTLYDKFEIGAGIYVIHARQGYEFHLDNIEAYTAGEQRQLFESNREIKKALGLVPGQWNETSFGDPYVYARLGNIWDYTLKFRRIDAGVSIGIMPPLAIGRQLNNPASLPLGGNGFFGVFGEIDAQFELKEDWIAGFDLIGLQRLPKERCERLPFYSRVNQPFSRIHQEDGYTENFPGAFYNTEPINYGVVIAETYIKPGFTIYFAPYFALERIRDGLGIRFIYHLIRHEQDFISTYAPVNFEQVEALSNWGADYISANLIYDFGYYKENREGSPVLSLSWDAPINLITAKRSSRTQVISLTLEVAF